MKTIHIFIWMKTGIQNKFVLVLLIVLSTLPACGDGIVDFTALSDEAFIPDTTYDNRYYHERVTIDGENINVVTRLKVRGNDINVYRDYYKGYVEFSPDWSDSTNVKVIYDNGYAIFSETYSAIKEQVYKVTLADDSSHINLKKGYILSSENGDGLTYNKWYIPNYFDEFDSTTDETSELVLYLGDRRNGYIKYGKYGKESIYKFRYSLNQTEIRMEGFDSAGDLVVDKYNYEIANNKLYLSKVTWGEYYERER